MKTNFKNNTENHCSIEQEINGIFNNIQLTLPDGLTAVKTKPLKNSSYCKGIIHIYRSKELESKPKPIVSYAFYPGTYKTSKIGSVAIYGENAMQRCLTLEKKGFLFGRRIISIKLENGRRPFVDVKFAA